MRQRIGFAGIFDESTRVVFLLLTRHVVAGLVAGMSK